MTAITGNEAVYLAVRLANVDVISASPITPQTSIVESLSASIAEGSLHASFINAESSSAALSALAGAAAAGARCFCASSSQGLAQMHEVLHWTAGNRLPVVMVNVNRALGAPLSIWADHSDSMSQRDTGWLQFYVASNQELLDTILQAYKIAELVRLPVMVNMDGFTISSTVEGVDLPDPVAVERFLPRGDEHTALLDTDRPVSIGSIVRPNDFQQFRSSMQDSANLALDAILGASKEFNEDFGRRYDLIQHEGLDKADVVVLACGSAASTIAHVAEQMRRDGASVGAVTLRVFRPFPGKRLTDILRDVKSVVVFDRAISIGAEGIICQELRAALQARGSKAIVHGVVTGLGGMDIKPGMIQPVIEQALTGELSETGVIWEPERK